MNMTKTLTLPIRRQRRTRARRRAKAGGSTRVWSPAEFLACCVGMTMLFSAACGVVEPDDPRESLEFRAEAEAVADTVHITLFVRNLSDGPVRLDWGGCDGPTGAALLAYDSANGGGTLRWDERNRDTSAGCFAVPSVWTLESGADVPLRRGIMAGRILGDSLAAGSYRLAVVPDFVDLVVETKLEVGVFHLVP